MSPRADGITLIDDETYLSESERVQLYVRPLGDAFLLCFDVAQLLMRIVSLLKDPRLHLNNKRDHH